MMRKTVFCLGIMVFAVLALAHGVVINVKKQSPFVKTKSSYSADEPMKNALVLIFAPSRRETEFQRGRTDAFGRFVFIPDRAGEWSFRVDDEMGHGKEVVISVSEEFINGNISKDQDDKTNVPVYFKIILGLSLIMGITGIFYGFKANRVLKSKK